MTAEPYDDCPSDEAFAERRIRRQVAGAKPGEPIDAARARRGRTVSDDYRDAIHHLAYALRGQRKP